MTITIASDFAQLDQVIATVVAPGADAVDREGRFPRTSIDALAKAGYLGLISAKEVGGSGCGIAEAALVVERLGQACGSTAMIMCMHYSATAVLEAHGTKEVREAIAGGRHLSTLAFSEVGSRSMFWAPLSTAVVAGARVRLDASKSWVTAAGEADSYVWSSRPLAAAGASTLWLVPKGAEGLSAAIPFNGLGLRGNDSSPVTASSAMVPLSAMLGKDGDGFNVMMGVVLPWFQVLNSAMSIGLMNAAVTATADHMSRARFEHLGQSVAEQPVPRSLIAQMRVRTDLARALWQDTIAAITAKRADTMLRVLEVKLAASEAALEVTDLGMRICGGAAFRRESPIERHFRDARAAAVMAPTSEALADFIGKAVCGLPLF
ncbi:MAG: acyl-CoA/acyl-ACP dehydrogenase [Planctomycetes bacterium]|nr:acyl-CoA/acyl-ACP dehydrogenase [Planctomycetota bacterium]